MAEPSFAEQLEIFAEHLRKAEERGFERGVRAERERIVKQLAFPESTQEPTAPSTPVRPERRVAHGTIRPLVRQVLETEDGLTKIEIGRRVVALDSRISETSVTNELQRNDARKKKGRRLYYRRGTLWYLADSASLNEAAGVAANDRPPLMNGATGDDPRGLRTD